MQYQETIPRKYFSRKEMAKRVARFSKLKGSDGGLPDSHHPSAERLLYNVIGFQPPPSEEEGLCSPVGANAARMAAIKISEGFNLGFCRALPGKGPMMHNHDTNETFICITGKWRASWEQPNGKVDHFDLDPLDVISFPPGCIRRFENVSKGPKNRYATLMFVIAGNGPSAEFSREAMAVLAEAGLLDAKAPRKARVLSTAASAKPAPARKSAPAASAKATTRGAGGRRAAAKPAAKASRGARSTAR
ncbi:MAG: cupin domain-containing protein [Gammaproteobacteria bacterium]